MPLPIHNRSCLTPWVICLWGLLLASSCASGEAVQRRRGAVTEAGRRIPPAAYSWYNRGLYYERQGQTSASIHAFRRALNLDPQSGSSWAALGRLQCIDSPENSYSTFEKGLKVATRHAPILIERASCRLLKARAPSETLEALNDAEQALAIEPDNPHATNVLVQCLKELKRSSEATRMVNAARIRHGSPQPRRTLPSLRAIDLALFRNDLSGAQTLALTQVTPGELALRALGWEKQELASEQARLVLKASPHDFDAALVLLILGQGEAGQLPSIETASPLAFLLFTLHLKRRVSEKDAFLFQTKSKLVLASHGDHLRALLIEQLTQASDAASDGDGSGQSSKLTLEQATHPTALAFPSSRIPSN